MADLSTIPLKRIDGTPATLGDYQGQVVLVVNVASKCGLTPQYTGLQSLYSELRDRGFTILGFPANNYGGQEPGTHEEIQEFCETNYQVEFPLFEKLSTRGDDQHPLYRELTTAIPHAVPNPEGQPRHPRQVQPRPQDRRRGHVELRKVPHRPRWQRRRPLRAGPRAR